MDTIAILKENEYLRTLIVKMTHHEGAVKETEPLWGPIVDTELRNFNSIGKDMEQQTNIIDNLKQHELLAVMVDNNGKFIEHVYREPSHKINEDGSPVPDIVYKERFEVRDGKIALVEVIEGKHTPGYYVDERIEFESK